MYQRALESIGSILAPYDPRQEFQAFGYGAQLPPQWAVSHAFALSGNNANPKVVGVAGLLAAYAQAIQTVRLHGPTNFAPIINAVAAQCHAGTAVNPFLYTVLLIVTDGEYTRRARKQDARARGCRCVCRNVTACAQVRLLIWI